MSNTTETKKANEVARDGWERGGRAALLGKPCDAVAGWIRAQAMSDMPLAESSFEAFRNAYVAAYEAQSETGRDLLRLQFAGSL